MAEVHDLVKRLGRDGARAIVPTDQKKAVDIAANVMGDEDGAAAFSYAGFAYTFFPYKRVAGDGTYTRDCSIVSMAIDPGSLKIDGKWRTFGPPYGALCRLVMIMLQSEAIRNNSPKIELGRNVNDFMTNRLGIEYGGKTVKILQDQIYRLAACTLKFAWNIDGKEHFESKQIIKSGFFLGKRDERQALLWDDTVVLDDALYRHLREHSVLLSDEAVRQLKDEPVALDAYVWLCFRLHHLERPVHISWQGLWHQFGQEYAEVRFFRRRFLKCLTNALAAYPEARVTVDETANGGITLHPSPPAVRRFQKA